MTAAVNTGNSLAASLVFYADFATTAGQDLVSGLTPTLVTTPFAKPCYDLNRYPGYYFDTANEGMSWATGGSAPTAVKGITTSMTVSFIVQASTLPASSGKFVCAPYRSTGWSAPNVSFVVDRYSTTDQMEYAYAKDTSGAISVQSDAGLVAVQDRPVLYTVRRSGVTVDFFRNGIKHGASKTLSSSAAIDFSSCPELIAMVRSSTSLAESVQGTLAMLAIWSRALSDSEIAALGNPLTGSWTGLTTPAATPQPDTGYAQILDTDFSTDVDDVMATKILAGYERQGAVSLVGAIIDSSYTYSPGALDAVLTYEGHAGITLGAWKGASVKNVSLYAQTIYNNFTHTAGLASTVTDSTVAYRTLLAARSSADLTIVSVGVLGCIDALLQSPADGISGLTGSQLMQAAVKQVIVMGGGYPTFSAESNFLNNAPAANHFVANCPVPLRFVGFETASAMLVGGRLQTDRPETDPTRQAIELFVTPYGRAAWDPFAVYLACAGAAGNVIEVRGTNSVDASTGANTFTPSPTGQHTYVVKLLPDTTYVDRMERRMSALDPTDRFLLTLTGSGWIPLNSKAPV